MNRTEIVTACIWLDQLAAHAKAERAKLAAQLSADARAEFEEQGTAPTWRIPDVATVAASVSHESAYVCDEKTFTEWVSKRYATEVETVTRVRPAFQTGLLSGLRSEGEMAFMPDGEVVPGVMVRPGGEFAGVSIRATAAAKEVFGALADAGLKRLALDAGPAVPVVLAEVDDVA